MTDKQLRKLKKAQLLEIMVEQSKEIDRLREEVGRLNAQLADRTLKISDVGSIAEASLKINDVFEQAQKAADLYLENVRRVAAEKSGGEGV